MDARGVARSESVVTSEHYLKSELYSRVSADSSIFEFLQAGSLDGIWYLDLEHPDSEWMSKSYKNLFGYEEDEIPNSSRWWQENIFPEDLPATLETFARHCADPTVPFDQIVRYRHKNGSTIWVRCRGLAIRDSSGRPIRMLGAHTDVTAIKRTEERLRALYEASPEMSFVANLETGVVLECNQALRENTGHGKIAGQPFLALLAPESEAAGEAALKALLGGHEIKFQELKLKKKAGGGLTVLLSAKPSFEGEQGPTFSAWCRDISHLKRFANVEVVIGGLPSGIILANEQGEIRSTNPAVDEMLGYAKGELAGKPLWALFAESTGEDRQAIRKDGALFPVHLGFSTIGLGEGTFQAVTIADMTSRQAIEMALRESEHRFRQLTESLPQLVWTCTPDGKCDYLSPQWIQFTGLPEAIQLEFGWLDQLHPDDREVVTESWSASLRLGVPFQVEYRIRRHDGVYCWFDTRSTPLRNPQNQIVKWFGASTEITERKRIEAEQEFLLELGSALQSSSSPNAIAEVSTRLLALRFQVTRCSLHSIDIVSDTATLLHEYSLEAGFRSAAVSRLSSWGNVAKASGMAAGNAVAIDSTGTHASTKDNYSTAFRPAGIESLLAIPLRRGGKWVGVLGLFDKQTRRWTQREIDLARVAGERIWPAFEAARALAAERALHESLAAGEQRLQLALQSAAIGIWENDPVHDINTWDDRSRSIFGFPPDLNVDGGIVMSCIHPEDRQAVGESIRAYVDPNGPGRFQTVYRIITWQGSEIRYVYAQGQMFYEGVGENRRPVKAIGTVQDVTALKRGEQALRRANLELEQFAYAAAHDLQEPLRNVGLATQVLASRYKGKFDKDADTLLKTAVDGPLRMQAMVKDLLAYSRALTTDEGTVMFADPNAVVESALKNLAVAIDEKKAQITVEPLPHVRMSELHLLQVFQNLISNSLKYSGPKQSKILIASTKRSGELVIYVKDNGLGIAPEYHERAFGVFKRLHGRDVPGTGIGLALCKRIVEHYGGRIWIESEAGEGATVLFTPPLASPPAS